MKHPLIKAILSPDLILPFILLLSYLIFLFLTKDYVPSSEILISKFAHLYANYGYEIIFTAALFESLVLINLVAPGGVALALGVVFARTGQTDLLLVILFASLGTVCGYLIDFALGYFGLSNIIAKLGYKHLLDRAKDQIKTFGKRGLVLGFIHSNLGSFLAIAAGTLKFEVKLFLTIAIFSTVFWACLWGLAVFALGDIILSLISKYSFLLILLVVLGMILGRLTKERM